MAKKKTEPKKKPAKKPSKKPKAFTAEEGLAARHETMKRR